MKHLFSSSSLSEVSENTVVVFSCSITKISDSRLKGIDIATSGALSAMVTSGEFSGKNGEVVSFTNPDNFIASRLLLVGLGDKKKLSANSFRKAMGSLSRKKAFLTNKKVAIHFTQFNNKEYYRAAIEGQMLGSFKMLNYKTGDSAKDKSNLTTLQFVVEKKSSVRQLEAAIEKGTIIAEGQLLTRRLAQTPGKDLTPRIYARKAQELAKKYGLACRILDEKEIAREKMGALLGVAVGSDEPPRFIILQYKGGKKGEKPVVLVGKGVTFDSGGISLKPGLNMHEMKQDMAGSAAVIGAMVTAARLGTKLNIVGLIPTTENMPSGKATKPGDILTARNGKTIEIINTDAEGRLILADALDYASKFKPQAVIDIATLTGATLFILGYAGTPIMGNNDKLLSRIEKASDICSEKVWRLPIWEDHRKQMRSSIADLVNSGGRPAGTICAGAFLESFTGDWPWAHIDIAYTDLEPSGKPYLPKGATGVGMRLLTEVLSNWKGR